MLISADQYRYIDASSVADYITGDIMPVRDARGDDSWKILKYEDPIFLKEAYLERMNWTRGPGNPSDPPLRRVHAADMNDFRLLNIRSPNSGATMYITADSLDALLARSIVTNIPSGTLTPGLLTEGLGRLALKPVEFQPVVFQNGGPLPADNIRKMYHNVRLARASLFTSARSMEDIFGEIPYVAKRFGWGERPLAWTDTPGSSAYTIYHAMQMAARLESAEYWEFTYPSEGSAVTHLGDLHYSYATRASMFLGLSVSYDQDFTSSAALVVLPCTVEVEFLGQITVRTPRLSDHIQWIVQSVGLPYVTSAAQLGSNFGGSVNITSIMFALVHDFPSDFDDHDWGWTPPA